MALIFEICNRSILDKLLFQIEWYNHNANDSTVDENITATIKIQNNYVAIQSFIYSILQ